MLIKLVNDLRKVNKRQWIDSEREELDDNLYEQVSKRRAAALAMSFRQTKENVGANVYNRAFNSTYTDRKSVV